MPPPIPLATYRLQLNKDFGFDAAARLVPYLKALGVSHLYASPFLKARAGSQHGYDIVDHGALNPEFGGEEAFARLSEALTQADMGLILDFVPNHMGIGYADNAWWLEVLEWGQAAPHARSFDISWELLPYRRGGGVLVPVLGRPYGDVLTSGEIALRYDPQEGSFSAWYFDHRFAINPQRYSDILKTIVAAADAADEPVGGELLALAREYGRPGVPSYAEAPVLKQRLAALAEAVPVIERGLAAYRTDHEAGVNALHRLLERQHYRLSYWRVAVSAINYRRFFDINDLAGIRIEDTRTFRAAHALVARLIANRQLHGLRLDHIDGLTNPLQYTRRLQQLVRHVRGAEGRQPFYVIIEKILAEGEQLPPFTGVAGTTGYEWLNLISRVLVADAGRARLDAFWRELAPAQSDFAAVLENAKLRVLRTILASEFTVLVQLLGRIAAGHYSTRDYTTDRLRDALTAYVLEFPVYRTYVTPAGSSPNDRALIDRVIAAARRRWQGPDREIFDFLRDALTLDLARSGLPYSRPRLRNFALKLQQFTGPLMAKSLEDTSFYRYHVLIALNEVGGNPALPPLPVADFHTHLQERASRFRHGLTATATHDTKRGEDARTRILALSEMPGLWTEHVARWLELNERHATNAGRRSPSLAHEYMLYQALVGVWPGTVDDTLIQRVEDYAIKAAREGKLDTSWTDPDEDYEQGLRKFVHAILDQSVSGEFLDSFAVFARGTTLLGALNSLTQLVLKATMPGVPDFYQGTELWDLSLVDPDNRRPVDFAARQAALDQTPGWPELVESWPDGRIKLALTRRLLQLRQEMPTLFRDGGYSPVEVDGPDREHVVAFMRTHRRSRVLVAVGRHFATKTDNGGRWPGGPCQAELRLDPALRSTLRDALGAAGPEQTLELSCLFRALPVAVLRSR